jgi:hypothetical protein
MGSKAKASAAYKKMSEDKRPALADLCKQNGIQL